MQDKEPLVLTPMEAAKALGLSLNKVYDSLSSGEIPGLQVGRRWLIPRRAFERWLECAGKNGGEAVGERQSVGAGK